MLDFVLTQPFVPTNWIWPQKVPSLPAQRQKLAWRMSLDKLVEESESGLVVELAFESSSRLEWEGLASGLSDSREKEREREWLLYSFVS